jgi:hypothetical protein
MTSKRRTEFVPFFLDLLDFMDEKICEAIADEASRRGAVGEAAGVIPLLRDRLRENEVVQGQFMLVDVQLYEPHAARLWAEFACMDRAAFEEQAADLVGPRGVLTVLRRIATVSRTR